jgi:hypothetical protein
METKHLIAFTLMALAIPPGVAICWMSQRARDLAFFGLVAGTVWVDHLDVNFFTHYWYRGTTRGLEITVLDVLAICLLLGVLLREGRRRIFWPASLGILLIYFLYGCFSLAISEPKIYGMFELFKIFRSIIVFLAAAMYVRGDRELSVLVFALGCAVCFEGLLSVKEHYLGGMYRVTGSLDHPNSLSVYICMACPLFVAAANSTLHRYLRYFCLFCIPVSMVIILFTVSRAGIPIFALVNLGTAVFCISWKFSFRKMGFAMVACIFLVIFVVQSWGRLTARFGQMTLADEYTGEQIESRGYYLRQAKVILDDHFFGVGLNNWSYWVSKVYGARVGYTYEDYDDMEFAPSKEVLPSYHYAAPAHSLGALTLGELGVPGLIIFAFVWLRWFQIGASFLIERANRATSRFGIGIFFSICGVFLQNLFEWVYRQTHITLAFHVLLGTLASLHYLKKRRKAAEIRERSEQPFDYESGFQTARLGGG